MPTRIGVFVAGLLKLLVQFTAILSSCETFNNQCQNISCTQTDLQARKTENLKIISQFACVTKGTRGFSLIPILSTAVRKKPKYRIY